LKKGANVDGGERKAVEGKRGELARGALERRGPGLKEPIIRRDGREPTLLAGIENED